MFSAISTHDERHVRDPISTMFNLKYVKWHSNRSQKAQGREYKCPACLLVMRDQVAFLSICVG